MKYFTTKVIEIFGNYIIFYMQFNSYNNILSKNTFNLLLTLLK
jgi:hypothetical protein